MVWFKDGSENATQSSNKKVACYFAWGTPTWGKNNYEHLFNRLNFQGSFNISIKNEVLFALTKQL